MAASFHIRRPESTQGYAPSSPKQHKHKNTQDRPFIQHTQKKHTCEPRTTASQSPSGLVVFHLERILAFLPLESLTRRSTRNCGTQGSLRPSYPSWLESWVCTPLEVQAWPLVWPPWLLVSAQHCSFSPRESWWPRRGNSLCFVSILKGYWL